MRHWLIEKLGGFPDLDSAIAHIKKTGDSARKREILAEAVKKLYNTIGADDILRQNEKGEWISQGRPLLPSEVTQLKQEAVTLLGMKIWRVLKMDIRYQLGKKMFEEAKVQEDIVWGQLLTYLDDVIRTRLQRMK